MTTISSNMNQERYPSPPLSDNHPEFAISPDQYMETPHQERNWRGAWIHFEKFANGIAPRSNNTEATKTSAEALYTPSSATASFEMPLYTVPRKECQIYQTAAADPQLVQHYLQKDTVTFAVHPQIAKSENIPYISEIIAHPARKAQVAATASTRTLYRMDTVNDLPEHTVKTHFGTITRWERHLRRRKIEHSVRLTSDLDQATKAGVFTQNPWFAYQPESFGAVYGKADDLNAWGYLIREMTPQPYVAEDLPLLPFFSLFRKDTKNPEEAPLLQKMINTWDEDQAKQFTLNKVLFPILDSWVDVFKATGAVLEPHGQNVLFEVKEGVPVRVVHRDLDVYVNKEIRERRGLDLKGLNPYEMFSNVSTEAAPQGSNLSLIFDQSMARAFEQVAGLVESAYRIPQEELQKACASHLSEVFPEGKEFFPQDGQVYDYTKGKLAAGAKATVELQEDQSPVWRE